jgi:branched-chain amino acid transport system substrate-binding protein
MGKKGWWIIIIIIVVVLIAYFAMHKGGSGGSAVTSDSGPIKIGGIEALTGDAAVLGIPQGKAMQLAVDQVNKDGGINGRMLELVSEDGKCDPQAGGTAAQKLVSVDKVAVIVGGSCSGETLAAAAITEPAHVVLISGSATSPKISTAGDYVFRTIPSDALAGKVAATYAYKQLNARKVAVISELTDYAQGLRNVYKDSFTALGGTIVADETYTTGDTDFRTQILKIKQANPDVIYVVPQSPTPGIAIMKQLHENGIKAKLTTAEVLLDRDAIKGAGATLEGVIGVEAGVDYQNNPQAKAYAAAYKAKFNEDPGTFSANAYDAITLVINAMKANNGKVDTNQIRDYLYNVKNWPGAVGSITMDKNGDPLLGLNVAKITGSNVVNVATNYTP